MNGRSAILRLLAGALVALIVAASRSARADDQPFTLNLWPGLTPNGQTDITAFVFGYSAPLALSPALYVDHGLSNHVDVFAGVLGTISLPNPRTASSVGAEGFVRYFFVPAVAVVLRVLYTSPDQLSIGPGIDAFFSWRRLAISINAAYHPSLAFRSGVAGPGSATVFIAPEYSVGHSVSVFIEGDLTATFGTRERTTFEASALVVPGVSVLFNKRDAAALGVQIPAGPNVRAVSIGAWYSATFPAP